MRRDQRIICDIVEQGSSVLDLGCGDGELLAKLIEKKQVRGQGIELAEEAIHQCVEKGLTVLHSDIDSGLIGYPDKMFDYVILNQSLQEVKKVSYVLQEALRVGKKGIVGFPNFAYFGARLQLLVKGKVPLTRSLPYRWYDTPNLHFFSVTDFITFCRGNAIKILQQYYLSKCKQIHAWPNLRALNAIFVIEK